MIPDVFIPYLLVPDYVPREDRISHLQALFLALLCGLLPVIIYCNSTEADTYFERFMSSQDFGVHLYFSGLGVTISFC